MINALRHQRLVHLRDINIVIRAISVINALRHQRLVHGEFWHQESDLTRDQRLTASKVSTRFYHFRDCLLKWVINALRHQRLVHGKAEKAFGV